MLNKKKLQKERKKLGEKARFKCVISSISAACLVCSTTFTNSRHTSQNNLNNDFLETIAHWTELFHRLLVGGVKCNI